MGHVFRAVDTRLNRPVAIKVCAASFGERFDREVRAISALNHPHICTLYDVGENYLVMELLEGETLADRLAKGALPLDQVIRYGVEIAEALEKAHKAGVVHRDLKPGNIMLTKSGAKLLDFGLAKPEPIATSELSTAMRPLTEEGTIVGTFQYMAPEQIEGKKVDHRADIWALGCLLYEMVTARRAFGGSTRASLAGAILRDEPVAPSRLQSIVPPAMDRVIATCLAKDPDKRWESAHDVGTQLRWMSEQPASVPARRSPRLSVLWAIAAVAAILVTALVAPRISQAFRGFHLGQPVVVMMDSTHPERVYDPVTRAHGGTNADDLTDVLHDLPVTLVKENTTWTWHREDEVLRQMPDLILIHRSAFYVPSGVNNEVFENEFRDRAWDRTEVFLGYVALANPRTKFIVYSRGSFGDAAGQKRWVTSVVKRFPQLRGRVSVWSVPLDRETFRHPKTGAEMKNTVVATLGLKPQ
jgi:protein kinase-like protein